MLALNDSSEEVLHLAWPGLPPAMIRTRRIKDMATTFRFPVFLTAATYENWRFATN